MALSGQKEFISVRAQDIQTGLQGYRVFHFEALLRVGAAARLAIHIRGRDAIEYDRLKELAALLFGVEKLAFPAVLKVLEEIEFARVVGTGSRRLVIPEVPYFDELYSRLSEYAEVQELNEYEKMSIEILQRLASGPALQRDIMRDLDLGKQTEEVVIDLGKAGSYIDSYETTDGDAVLISPVYFSEKPEEVAKAVGEYGVESTSLVFNAVRAHPGWPLAAILRDRAIGNVELHPEQVELVKVLVSKGILQPPAVTTTRTGTNHFVFTPPLGSERVRVIEKEIYEKAMALIAAVRQGQHFAAYPIRSPRAVINALLRDRWLRPTTEAKEQWRAVALLRICDLVHVGGGWYEVRLICTEENLRAVKLALQLFDAGDVIEDRGLDSRARIVLEGGDIYHESLRGVRLVKEQTALAESARCIQGLIDQLLEQLQRG